MNQSRPEQRQNISGNGKNSLSLQTRLVMFVLFVALVPLIIIATRDTLQTQQALTKGAEISLKAGAAQTANNLDNFIQKTLDSVAAEAELADLIYYIIIPPTAQSGIVVRERTMALLNTLTQKDSLHIISYAIVDTDGNVLLDNTTDVKYNESKEAYFSQVRFNDKPTVTGVTYSEDKTTSITFASKIINNKEYIGILRVKYNATVLQDVITNSVGTSTDASVLLIDQFNIRMADSQNPELILKSIVPLEQVDYLIAVDTHRFLDIPREEQATNYIDFDLALDNAVNQPFFRADITPDMAGDDTIAVAFMQTQPWTVTYSRPTSIFLADVQKQIRTNIVLVLITSIIILVITTLIARTLTNPIIALAKVANSISQGDLNARAEINTTDEIGSLASAFNSMTDQLQSTLVGLEQRIFDRTVELKKTNIELEIIAEVAREIAVIRDLQTLLVVSVSLIRERLNYYHVGIFLVDERGELALLQAASSAAAEKMLALNIKFRINGMDPLGNALRAGQVYYSPDIRQDKVLTRNPLLPESVSEALLPLRIRNVTMGVLDIQASNSTSLGEREINTLKLLADQLAAAIENAQLVQQVEGTLSELTNTNRSQTQKTWQTAINQRERPAYEYDGLQVRTVPQNLPENLLKQLETGKPIVVKLNAETKDEGNRSKNTLMIPLLVLNQVIGVIGLEQEDPNHIWSDEEIAIAQAAANRTALTLENARLLEESQRRAIKERTIFNATARIGSAVNIENILNTTAEEIERVLNSSELILQFTNDKSHDRDEAIKYEGPSGKPWIRD
jgi:GAF domain-containing protein/HAMP domain-containing protein